MGSLEQGVQKSAGRYAVIPRVLVFVTISDAQGDDVLLLRGAPTKRIWPNKLNGVGGHVERDESVAGAARREAQEETGLAVGQMLLRGVVNIDARAEQGIMMFVFTAVAPHREVVACAEGALEWWPRAALPQRDLVEDLATILPRVLALGPADPPFSARYWYDDQDQLQIELA